MVATLVVAILPALITTPPGAAAAVGVERAGAGFVAGTGSHSVIAAGRDVTPRGHRTGPQGVETESASVTTSAEVVGTANFEVGDTYTQRSHLAQGGEPSAVASAKHLLSSMGTFQNASLMGWGEQDPEPSPAPTAGDPWTAESRSWPRPFRRTNE